MSCRVCHSLASPTLHATPRDDNIITQKLEVALRLTNSFDNCSKQLIPKGMRSFLAKLIFLIFGISLAEPLLRVRHIQPWSSAKLISREDKSTTSEAVVKSNVDADADTDMLDESTSKRMDDVKPENGVNPENGVDPNDKTVHNEVVTDNIGSHEQIEESNQ